MNVNIYYGGRGLINDPTVYVLNKMAEVLEELRINVTRYNLYEHKNAITALPQTLKGADGIILATTVEWYGIGGYMQQFLDACWLFGDKEVISKIYMCPVVMSTTYGERDAQNSLATAWEILGGLPCDGMCGYIENTLTLENDDKYLSLIGKKAENMYRTMNQQLVCFPSGNQIARQRVAIEPTTSLTPQETEQLSQYASDDTYVQKQKEDIQELADIFKGLLGNEGAGSEEEYLGELRKCFTPMPGFVMDCMIHIEEKQKKLLISVKGPSLSVSYGTMENAKIEMFVTRNTMEDIINGRMTFQRAFMTGSRTKGDIASLRKLDQVFPFSEKKK